MPRVKPLSPNWETECKIRNWIYSGVRHYDVKTQKELMRRTGIAPSTFAYRMRKPMTFKVGEIIEIGKHIGKLSDF